MEKGDRIVIKENISLTNIAGGHAGDVPEGTEGIFIRGGGADIGQDNIMISTLVNGDEECIIISGDSIDHLI